MAALTVPELPETSRTGAPGLPELPAPPTGGGRNGDTEANDKRRTLEVPKAMADLPPDKLVARAAVDGVTGNARSLVLFGAGTFGDLSLTECANLLRATAGSMNEGDLSAAVTMLSSQAVALDAVFGELARRAAVNLSANLDASERYLRLALKAQGQCRATLETLAAIKNPPLVYARQANINNGGQQQVNNGGGCEGFPTPKARARARRGGRVAVSAQNELIAGKAHGGAKVDA